MAAKSWRCPYCNHYATLQANNISVGAHEFIGGAAGLLRLQTTAIVCPNLDCNKFTLKSVIWRGTEQLDTWPLVPDSLAKALPDYIPQAIREDYDEACKIENASPKGSATLARRCLQGMIRDFWKTSRRRLVDEIEAIKDRVSPEVWDAIEGVRQVGNIGAHMEADINVIVDVDPGEARLLIELIEMLLDEWYIQAHERKERLRKVKELAASKEAARKQVPATEAAPASV